MDVGLGSLHLCVSVNGQPGGAIKWLPDHTLVVLPAYAPGVGLMLLGLGLESQVTLSLALYLNL